MTLKSRVQAIGVFTWIEMEIASIGVAACSSADHIALVSIERESVAKNAAIRPIEL